MKHLVPYNESETFLRMRNILYDLKDICIEAEDKGLLARVFPSNEIQIKVLSLQDKVLKEVDIPFYVEIIKFDVYKRQFKVSDISDVIYHIIDYMKTNGYNTRVYLPEPHHANRFIEIKQGTSFSFELHQYTYTLQLVFEKI